MDSIPPFAFICVIISYLINFFKALFAFVISIIIFIDIYNIIFRAYGSISYGADRAEKVLLPFFPCQENPGDRPYEDNRRQSDKKPLKAMKSHSHNGGFDIAVI